MNKLVALLLIVLYTDPLFGADKDETEPTQIAVLGELEQLGHILSVDLWNIVLGYYGGKLLVVRLKKTPSDKDLLMMHNLNPKFRFHLQQMQTSEDDPTYNPLKRSFTMPGDLTIGKQKKLVKRNSSKTL